MDTLSVSLRKHSSLPVIRQKKSKGVREKVDSNVKQSVAASSVTMGVVIIGGGIYGVYAKALGPVSSRNERVYSIDSC